HEQMARFLGGLRRDAHPMAMLVASVGALSAFYHDTTDISDPHQRMVASFRLIGKMPTLAAMAYKYSLGQPFIYPKNELDYASNFLHMCFAVPCEDYKINPVFARALDRIFILYADHEQNPSTSTVRLAGSSGANPFACVAAGMACLRGPAHGGASEAAFKMLMEVEKIALNDEYFIERKLYPNIDFYAGIILKAIGFPVSMFTMLFAVARTPGWIAQWKEMIEDPSQKIGRPRQLYIGSPRRDYVAIDKRSQ